MTNTVTASAPGKIVLSGEYAVLDGAPACVMAVDRRARIRLTPAEGTLSTVAAPGYTDAVGRFRQQDGVLEWLEGAEDFRVVDAVWRAVGVEGAYRVELDTSAFFAASGQKLGLGSSAALTVALSAAASRDGAGGGSLLALAQQAHSELQGGVGSGVDIACSVSGGLLEYRRRDASVAALDWPEGLSYRVIFTGVAANTGQKLQQLAERASMPSRDKLKSAAAEIAEAWHSGDSASVQAGYSSYTEVLFRFSNDHGLGIFDAGHEALWQAAAAAGLTYKPCGAGGGDVGILLGPDESSLDAFITALPDGVQPVDCSLSPKGATVEFSATATA